MPSLTPTGRPTRIPARHEADEFAAIAWYHDYVRNPQQALSAWNEKAKKARANLNMASHLALLNWWAPTEIEQRASKTPAEAYTLFCLGAELSEATLGNRTSNLRRATACFEAALRVFTEKGFPVGWAMTQHNLGNAYADLPRGTIKTAPRDRLLRGGTAGLHREGIPGGLGADPVRPRWC